MVDPTTSKKLIAIGLFGLSVVLVGASFNISNNNWQNIVVVLAGVSLTFAVALAIIDSITDNLFEKQWSVVRILTYEEIATHLCDMLWFLDYKMKILRYAEGIGQPLNDIIDGRVIPYTGFSEKTNRAIPELLRNLQSIDISKPYDPSDEIVNYYESIKPERDRIHNLMYNVIQSSRNQRVINSLIEFDKASSELSTHIQAQKEVCCGGLYPRLLKFVETSGNLYNAMYEEWSKNNVKIKADEAGPYWE